MKKIAILLLTLVLAGCATDHVTFWDPGRTVQAPGGWYLEGDVNPRWSQQKDLRTGLRCVVDTLDLDVSLDGSVVVTDDPDTFRAYFNAWQSLFDPLPAYTAFAWDPVYRGRQTLAPGADWIIIVYDPSVGDRSPLLVLAHELLHVAGYAHEDTPFEELPYVAELCE